MLKWKTQSPTMKRVWIALAILTVFISVHGTWTYRENNQIAFARAVEKRIDISSIHVKAISGVLVLEGRASREQSEYAQGVAKSFIDRYAHQTVNPPTDVRNDITVDSFVSFNH